MTSLPSGTVTFLFTDIEGSTRLLAELGADRYAKALAQHRKRLRDAFRRNGGVELGTQGDSFFVAFDRASAALAAAREAQSALANGRIRVRMGIHTGEPLLVDGDYVGMDVHKAARIAGAGHGGQVLVSEQTARLAGLEDVTDLGLHRLKDLSRPEHLFQLAATGLPREFPPLRTLDLHPHNLPLQPTPLVGRERQIRELVERLGSDSTRLVTLTGPAGTGKTRLSLAVAAELVESFPDGVFFVDLAPITDPNLVLTAIARVVGAREEAGSALLDVVQDLVREKRMLLVLDNLEQVVSSAAEIAALLAAAAELHLLVTSRIPLNVRGEREYPVPPLHLPEPGVAQPPDRIARYEAVQLFLDRAQAVRPDFRLTEDNASTVAEICRRLDGLPLAIELAAARIRILAPEAMLGRLVSRLRLLTAGPRDVPTRQQTLRGAIDWSHDLLRPGEKLLFRRIGVFAGGASLDAVEDVCGDEALGLDVLDGVTSLVEKSLLRQGEAPGGEPRVTMLETMQEYAREKLQESGERTSLGRRHALHFLSLAERAAPQLNGPAQVEWLARLERDHDNLRAALRWMLDAREVEMAVRLAGGLQTFWMAHAHLREGSTWLREVLADAGPCAPAARAKALIGAGALARQQGDYGNAETFIRECLQISDGIGDRRQAALARINLGAVLGEQGDMAKSERVFRETLPMLKDLGEDRLMAMLLTNLGVTAELRGDRAAATELYEESLHISRRNGDGAAAALAVSNLGHLAFGAGDYTTAGARFRESMRLARSAGHSYWPVHELADLALVAGSCGLAARAARLFAASEALLGAIGARQLDADQEKYRHALSAARAALSPDDWERAWGEGAAMSEEEAIEYALEEDQ